MEFGLSLLLRAVIGDTITPIRVMYAIRSESARINIADSLMRNKMKALSISGLYRTTIAEMKFCTKIRNQLSHAYWNGIESRCLSFFDIEKIALSESDNPKIEFRYLSQCLLTSHENFFGYVDDLLTYLEKQYRHLALGEPEPDELVPKKENRPKLYIPRDELDSRLEAKDQPQPKTNHLVG